MLLRHQLVCVLAQGFVIAFAGLNAASAAVTISTGATKNMVCASGVCSPNHKTAVLNITDLQNLLATSNATVTTGSGSLAAQTLDIIVNCALTWSSNSALTLDAYRSVTINKAISVTGTGGLAFVTNDGSTGGVLSFTPKGNINFSNLTSSLTINGATYTLVGNIATLASDIAANPAGDFALASSYDARGDGAYAASPIATTFTGSFEGLGNSIRNLTIVHTEAFRTDTVGLFAETFQSEVRDLGVINVYVKGIEQNRTGGLVGWNLAGTLSGDFTTGRVFGAEFTGGLVGLNQGTISLSHSAVSVHAREAGGLVGYDAGLVERSFATGGVTANASFPGLGGLVGVGEGTYTNCYATGSVQGEDGADVGGLIGENPFESYRAISSSYSTGAVTGGFSSETGGVIGLDKSSSGSIADSYWDTTTSGVTNLSQGAGSPSNDPGITGLTTSQLQSGLPTGFDPSVWGQNPAITGGLPYLLANPPQ